MTEKEKMLSGEVYSAVDPELLEELMATREVGFPARLLCLIKNIMLIICTTNRSLMMPTKKRCITGHSVGGNTGNWDMRPCIIGILKTYIPSSMLPTITERRILLTGNKVPPIGMD